MAFWKLRFAIGELYFVSMQHQKSLETFQSLSQFVGQLGMESELNSPKYQCALYDRMARIYCECLCIRKAHEASEAATLLASMDKASVHLKFKY